MTEALVPRQLMELSRHKLSQPHFIQCLRRQLLVQSVYRCAAEEDLVQSFVDCLPDDILLGVATPAPWLAEQWPTSQPRDTSVRQEWLDRPVEEGPVPECNVGLPAVDDVGREELAVTANICKRSISTHEPGHNNGPDAKRVRGQLVQPDGTEHSCMDTLHSGENTERENVASIIAIPSTAHQQTERFSSENASSTENILSPESDEPYSSPPNVPGVGLTLIAEGVLDEFLTEDWANGDVEMLLYPTIGEWPQTDEVGSSVGQLGPFYELSSSEMA